MSPYASRPSTGKMTNRPHFAHIQVCIAGKKKPYTALLQCRTFLCRKKEVHRGKISVVDMAFLVFIRLVCIHHRPGTFFFETRKVLQNIFIRWWLCTFFSSLHWSGVKRRSSYLCVCVRVLVLSCVLSTRRKDLSQGMHVSARPWRGVCFHWNADLAPCPAGLCPEWHGTAICTRWASCERGGRAKAYLLATRVCRTSVQKASARHAGMEQLKTRTCLNTNILSQHLMTGICNFGVPSPLDILSFSGSSSFPLPFLCILVRDFCNKETCGQS